MIPPLENIKFWAGAGVLALILSSSYHLDNSPSDIDAARATESHRQDALNDALAAAQAERRRHRPHTCLRPAAGAIARQKTG